ncbi:MAG TPA: hypothetical protein VHW73_14145 [Rudaea sp.]|jgi:hypothetical protein|nr:hypothetical protein [Rudaea sp.]
MAGYSATPLAAKLGIKNDTVMLAIDAPPDYRDLIGVRKALRQSPPAKRPMNCR